MGKLMRIALIVFALATALSLGLLATLWFAWDPLLPGVRWLAGMSWFSGALIALLAVTGTGVVVLLAAALATPRKSAHLALAQDGGRVSITRKALSSTVSQTIEEHRGLTCKQAVVRILGKRSPRLRIKAKVDPSTNESLATLGMTLQNEVAKRVGVLAGYPVQTVDITFVEPSNTKAAADRSDERTAIARSMPTAVPHTI